MAACSSVARRCQAFDGHQDRQVRARRRRRSHQAIGRDRQRRPTPRTRSLSSSAASSRTFRRTYTSPAVRRDRRSGRPFMRPAARDRQPKRPASVQRPRADRGGRRSGELLRGGAGLRSFPAHRPGADRWPSRRHLRPTPLSGRGDRRAGADKQTRWADTCNLFGLPIVYFVDVPGLMIGPEGERTGVLRRGYARRPGDHRAHGAGVHGPCAPGVRPRGAGHQATRRATACGSPGQPRSGATCPCQPASRPSSAPRSPAAEDPIAKRKEVTESFAAQMSMWRTVKKFGVEEVIDPRETRIVLARLVKVRDEGDRPGAQARSAGPSVTKRGARPARERAGRR